MKIKAGDCVTVVKAALACLVVMLAGGAAHAQASAQRVAFNIRAQSMEAALTEFGAAAGLQVFFPSKLTVDKAAPEVVGTLSAEEALERLLEGSSLRYEFINATTVAIREVGEGDGKPVALGDAQSSALRVAQREATARTAESEQQAELKDEAEKEQGAQLEEIVVTGTHIRGVSNKTSPSLTITREDIDRAGFSSTEQLVESLPQNFGGGASQDSFTDFTGVNVNNIAAGSSINLRGLGTSSTLVLLNGRRLAPGGFDGQFVDVSTIPLNAIERVEVLPDGASAIYGSDAIGGVVNFVMRKNYSGSETRLRAGGVTQGSSMDWQFGQILGKAWDDGNVMLAYNFSQRDHLPSTERRIAADTDLTGLGGDNFSQPGGNPANVVAADQTYAIPSAQDGTALTQADFTAGTQNLNNLREGWDFLPKQQTHALFANARQALNDRVEVFAEARYAQRRSTTLTGRSTTPLEVPNTNPFFVDPSGTALTSVTVDGYNLIDDLGPIRVKGEVESYGGTLGGSLQLASSWNAELSSTYSQESTSSSFFNIVDQIALNAALAGTTVDTAFNPFGDGSHTHPAVLDSLRTSGDRDSSKLQVWGLRANLDGTVFEIPGGAVKLAVGAEYREDSVFNFRITGSEFEAPIRLGGLDTSRDSIATYAEFFVPLVGEGNARPGIRRLELSIAGRYEHDSNFGGTTNPKLGMLWSPAEPFALRGSYGTSFKAPLLRDLDDSTGAANSIIWIPAGILPVPTLVRLGGNPDLQPEEARTWTAGIDFMPSSLPGFHSELTYFNIDFTDRIAVPGQSILDAFLPQFSSLLNQNPTQEQINELASDPLYLDLFGVPPQDLISGAVPVQAIADFRLNNIAASRVSGLDAQLSYGFSAPLGRFELGLNGSYLIEFEQKVIDAAPSIDVVDTVLNPAALRLRGSLTWSRNAWQASAFVNYIDSYTDDESLPNRRVSSWTTIDGQLAYDLSTVATEGWLSDTRISLTAQNLFDENPPFVNRSGGLAYDSANADGIGRFIAVQVVKAWR